MPTVTIVKVINSPLAGIESGPGTGGTEPPAAHLPSGANKSKMATKGFEVHEWTLADNFFSPARLTSIKTDFVAFIFDDGEVDFAALRRTMSVADPEHHMIATAPASSHRHPSFDSSSGNLAVSPSTVPYILDCGPIFNVAALKACLSEEENGNFLHLCLDLLLKQYTSIMYTKETVFGRSAAVPNGSARNLDFREIKIYASKLQRLADLYAINNSLIFDLRRRVAEQVRSKHNLSPTLRKSCLEEVRRSVPLSLKRIVMLTDDSSTIGGIPGRTRRTIEHGQARPVEYVNIASRNRSERTLISHFDLSSDKKRVLSLLDQWSPGDTVFFSPNNVIRRFGKDFKHRVDKFPIVHMYSGQLSFMVQDQTMLTDLDYVRGYKVSSIMSFSDMDISFQRQLGIHGQIKGWLPVEVREQIDCPPKHPRSLGYVGRIDFHCKAVDRLLDVADLIQERAWPPIKVYTTSGSNSPDYSSFMREIERRGLERMFDVVLNCEDQDEIYRSFSILLLPSKKESFGQVILEAFSYGIPVVADAYAPGPSELVGHGQTGLLIEGFKPEAVVSSIADLSKEILGEMSTRGFEFHKRFGMSGHLDLLESVAQSALDRFLGENEISPYPELAIARDLSSGKLGRNSTPAMLYKRAAKLKRVPVRVFRRLSRLMTR